MESNKLLDILETKGVLYDYLYYRLEYILLLDEMHRYQYPIITPLITAFIWYNTNNPKYWADLHYELELD